MKLPNNIIGNIYELKNNDMIGELKTRYVFCCEANGDEYLVAPSFETMDKKFVLSKWFLLNVKGKTFKINCNKLICVKNDELILKHKVPDFQTYIDEYEVLVKGKKTIVKEKELPVLVEFDPEIIYTITSSPSCKKIEHIVKEIETYFFVIDKNGIAKKEKAYGWCCEFCGRNYIRKSSYERLKKKGAILCKAVNEDLWATAIAKKHALSDESVLHICGYSVGEKVGLSEKQRQRILEAFIDKGMFTKQKIINHLNAMIKLNKTAKGKEDAVNKWRRDLEYISHYQSEK